jgi:hypothetical protein
MQLQSYLPMAAIAVAVANARKTKQKQQINDKHKFFAMQQACAGCSDDDVKCDVVLLFSCDTL